MKQQATVTNSEWIIMELLWVHPYTLMELVVELQESVGWSKSTVATMVRRMNEKGIIRYKAHGRTKIFRPAVSREEVSLQETKSLLQRAYHGSLGLLVSTMVQEHTLTHADIDELYQVLKQAEEEIK